MTSRALITAAALTLALAAPAVAQADTIGLQVVSADPGKGEFNAVMHCVAPDLAGQVRSFKPADGVLPSPGENFGADVDFTTTPPTLRARLPQPPCTWVAAPPPPGPGAPPPGPGGPVGPGGPGLTFMPSFLNRVWKFSAEIDSFEDGRLSITISKVLNLPKRFASQDDDLVDQDAIVLVSKKTKIKGGSLASADAATVQGKLLSPKKWLKDEDDEPVATIRAKRITVTD